MEVQIVNESGAALPEGMQAKVEQILASGVLEKRKQNLKAQLEEAGKDLLAGNVMWADYRLKSDPLRALIKRYITLNQRYQEVCLAYRAQEAMESLPDPTLETVLPVGDSSDVQ